MPKSREIHLVQRPTGALKPDDFALVERDVADAADGQVLIQNLLISVDPGLRVLLAGIQPLGEVMGGGALGRVVQSKLPGFAVGDLVTTDRNGFREYLTAGAGELTRLSPDPELPLSVYMHALGGPGLTAYGGLLQIGQLKDGEQVFVSSASGPVGSVAAQIARIKGCYVVGSTGSEDKAAWLRDEAGLDAVINYKTHAIGPALQEATPKGIDVYFENVGGDHMEAALQRMNPFGRVAVCGFISGYDSGHSSVSNLSNIIPLRVTLRGFTTLDFMHLEADFQRDMAGWLKAGKIKYRETIMEGIDQLPAALIGLLAGQNNGKTLVKVGS